MTIQEFIKQGHKWIELKGVPVRDSHRKKVMYIHSHFFEGKELEFQNKVLSSLMEVCPNSDWNHRVYGGDTPDAEYVDWIYTQTAEIVSVYVTVSNGIVQDVFPNRDMAIKDMHRHVYNTLVGCCGGKVEGDGETCCVVSYQDKEQNDTCMVVPFDPANDEHRKAYNAQRSFWNLPELPDLSVITEAEGVKVGDKVRHNKHEEVATVTAIREAFANGCDGYRYLYTLDFGQSVKGPFGVELNGGEFLREAFTVCEA